MYKYLLTLFILLISKFAISQYIPIPEQNASWHINQISGSIEGTINPIFVGVKSYINYDIDGHQTINGKEYVRVNACGNNYYTHPNYQFTIQINPATNSFYYRNDSVNKKVYGLIDADTLNEFTLYDFNLQVGDSTQIYTYSDSILKAIDAVVDRVDSVVFKNHYHKRIHFTFSPYQQYDTTNMYEGIGFYDGIFPRALSNHNVLSGWKTPETCFQSENLSLYNFFSIQDSCQQYSCRPLGISELNNNLVALYPNPSTNQLHFIIEDNKKYEVVFYNLMGQKVHSQPIANDAEIDVRQWERGIYFYQILDDGKSVGSGKFVKE